MSGRPPAQPLSPRREPPTATIYPQDSRPESCMTHASDKLGAVRNGEFSWRAPSPPHIHVPQTPDDVQIQLPHYEGIEQYQLQEGEKYAATLGTIVSSPRAVVPCKDWRYEWRREAQRILSYLYLGPSSAARDTAFLQREGITMLMVVRDTMTAQAKFLDPDKVAQQLGIEGVKVDVNGNPELIAGFPRAIKIINDHLVRTARPDIQNLDGTPSCGKILVYCESGNERSAAVVAAYLMKIYGIDVIKAIQYVQSQRFCISFDDALKNLLYNYGELLTAQRAVASAPKSPNRPVLVSNTVKRGRNEVDEGGDMGMGMEDDEARFGGRQSFVPFK